MQKKNNLMKIKSYFILGILLVLSIGFVSAGFSYKSNNLITNYSAGEKIKGTFNISFNNELADNIFTSNLKGNISLLDFLNKNNLVRNINFNCSTVSCGTDYNSAEEVSQISLTQNQEKFIGFKITGEQFDSASEISLTIQSNAVNSCAKQVEFKFLGNEKEMAFVNSKYVDEKCSIENYGCFNLGLGSYSQATIGNSVLCEKMSLPAAPAYRLGAKVKNTSNGVAGQLKMQLYDLDENLLGQNTLPSLTKSEYKITTIINYSSAKPGNYLVCITGESGTEYKINRETEGTNCGTNNFGNDNYNKDYEIFAYPLKFGAVNFEIKESPTIPAVGESVLEFIEDYIFDHYDGECNPECIVPISFSGVAQTLGLSNAKIKYSESGDNIENNKIYSVAKNPAKITSNELKLDLSKTDFLIPLGSSEEKFKLFLNNQQIFEKSINLKKSFDFDITPKFVLVGIETKFQAITNESINSSIWKFTEGVEKSSNSKNSSYTYLKSGANKLEVELMNKFGIKSKKIFDVISGNAKISANLTLQKYKTRISNLTKSYDIMPLWIKKELEKEINPTDLNAKLKIIENDFKIAVNDSDYVDLINDLIKLNVPVSVFISEKGNLPIEAGLEGIDTSYVEEISVGGDFEDLDKKISAWIRENYEVNIDFEIYSALYDTGIEDVLTKFKFDINKLKENDDTVYLFIDFPIEKIKFKESYSEKPISAGAGTYIPLIGSKDIEFVIPEKIYVEDLRAYLSPEAKFLPTIVDDEEVEEQEEGKFEFSFTKFVIGAIVLIIIFFTAYIALQEWYKKNYEKHLFENKDLLYNLLSFIYNGRANGLTDSEIGKKLEKSGWNSEQITYAFRKIDGKRTGMFEIPIFKSIENKKVRQELEKRLPPGRRLDARFIKSPEI